MEDNSYLITSNTKFIIYGAATTGAIFYRNIVKQGYKVLCFLDQRAHEIDSYLSLPVYTIDECALVETIDDDCIVIVAIKNVFEHDDVAEKLIEAGFNKILYKTYNLINNIPATEDIVKGKMYDELFEGKEIVQTEFPITKVTKFIPFKDYNSTNIDSKYVFVKIPAAFIYSDKYNDNNCIWNSVNIMGLVPHIDFFKCIQGTSGLSYDDYMSYCFMAAERSGGILTSESWKRSVIENRVNVYQNMELNMQLQPEFFEKNAPLATLGDNRIFNIHSGKHRMVYQIVKGKVFLTIKVLKSDYINWLNESVAIKIYNYLKKNKIRKLEVPIMNPFFYKFPCDNMMFYYEVQKNVIYYLYRYWSNKYENLDFNGTVCNYGKQGMMLNPILSAMGFKIYTDDCDDEYSSELYHLMYKLYCIDTLFTEDLNVIPQIVITDKIDCGYCEGDSTIVFYISNYDEKIDCKKQELIIASGFCNGIRKKVVVLQGER